MLGKYIHSGTLDPDITWNVSFEDSAAQIYRWRGPSVTSGKLVHRVPFNHPSQLYPILQLLRQQQMFNTLFQSIFNDKSVMAVRETRSAFSLDRIIEECRADTRLHVDVANVDTPAMIHLTISLPPSAQSGRFIILPLSIEISRETPARPTVKLNPPSAGERDPLNRLTGYNITLLVRWLWNRIERNPNVDYMIQTSRLHKRQSRIDEMNSNHEKRRRL
ncbi:hypothetical protein BX666DRAFT_1227281 [Dichotomocladium elegans]|nr:hypothetical protein BX666DRAFT_1227281 [Dichotomocladium elegans]